MRTKYILLTILSSLVFASCNYLDFDETNNLKTKEDMYKYFGTSKSMLTHVPIWACRAIVRRSVG